MLSLKRSQLDQVADHRRATFRRGLVRYLRTRTRGYTGDQGDAALEATLETVVTAAEAIAARHGITRGRPIAGLAELVLVLGPDFDLNPRYAQAWWILSARQQPGWQRVDRLADWLSGEGDP